LKHLLNLFGKNCSAVVNVFNAHCLKAICLRNLAQTFLSEGNMKGTIFKIILAAMITASGVANSAEILVCENGTFDEMGDGHYGLTISKDSLDFYPYEGHFPVSQPNVLPLSEAGLISITDYEAEMSSEGETWTEIINLELTYDPAKADDDTLEITLEGEWPVVFKCKKQESELIDFSSVPMM
jgi:hypothetical protein